MGSREEFYGKQFELALLHPGIWVLEARRLRSAADLIFAAYLADLAAFEHGQPPSSLDHLELVMPASLLYGLAVENLLKAIILKNVKPAATRRRLPEWPSDGHDLEKLASRAIVTLNDCERDMLRRLSAFVRWAGRYPIPKALTQMWLVQRGISPDFVPLPLQPPESPLLTDVFTRLESLV